MQNSSKSNIKIINISTSNTNQRNQQQQQQQQPIFNTGSTMASTNNYSNTQQLITTQTQDFNNVNQTGSNSSSPTKLNSKIKIIQPLVVDPSQSSKFEALFIQVQNDIEVAGCNYNLSPVIKDDYVNYQFWQFKFEGSKNFQGKCISGVLQFHQNHPIEAPKFYFDPIITNDGQQKVLQHLNIYGDHSLCIPLFTFWKSQTNEFDILQAIENIFHNPNEGDNANPNFFNLSEEQKNQVQQNLAQYLPEFQLDR